jgi:GT2 family glycosyltransferase
MARTVSVVVPIFNGLRYIDAFFASLHGALPDAAQLILVDDASTEPVLDKVPEFPMASEIVVVKNEHNLGYSAAVNRGFARCDGDYVVQLNTDLVLDAGCIAAMLDLIDSKPQTGLVGSKLIYPTTGLVQHIGMAFGYFSRPHVYYQLPADHPLCCETRAMQIVTGATVACTRQVLDLIGPLDERYFNHNEDLDHCMRATVRGLKNYTCAESIAYHWTSQSGPARFARTEESDALFWSTWRSRAEVDLDRYVSRALERLVEEHPEIDLEEFEMINLCRGGDDGIVIDCVSRIAPRAASRIRYHRQTNSTAGQHWLPMVLPHWLAASPAPFLYLVDEYRMLSENRLWFEMRRKTVTEEVILDTTGTAVTVSEAFGAGGPHGY